MTAPNPYPDDFHIAHALFTGASFRAGGEWGEITDGPSDWDDLMEAVAEHFSDADPAKHTLRVWWFRPGVAATDITASVIEALAEQRDTDDAPDADEYGDWKHQAWKDRRMDMEMGQ